jgi:hypothetical protein
VMQDDAGDKANHEPESRLKSCLESRRHAFNHVTDWRVTPGRIRCLYTEPIARALNVRAVRVGNRLVWALGNVRISSSIKQML